MNELLVLITCTTLMGSFAAGIDGAAGVAGGWSFVEPDDAD